MEVGRGRVEGGLLLRVVRGVELVRGLGYWLIGGLVALLSMVVFDTAMQQVAINERRLEGVHGLLIARSYDES